MQNKAPSEPSSKLGRFPFSYPIQICINLLFACLVFCTNLSAAEEPEVHVAIGAEEIFIGESVDYQVDIRNAKNPPEPDLSAFKDQFDVVSAGNQSQNQSSISIINGKVSEQNIFSHIYQYRLTPKSAGKITVPAPKVTLNGKTISGPTTTLTVSAPEEQDLVVVEVEVSHKKVYPTQPFTTSLRLFVQPLPNDAKQDPLTPVRKLPPHIQINWVDPIPGLVTEDKQHWLQPMLSDEGVGFTLNDVSTRSGSFFDGPRAAVFNFRKGRETQDGLDGTPINYHVYELKRTFTPETTGTYSFGPAVIKGTFVEGINRREYKGKRLVVTAPAVNVEVREVPSPRPATFCGGIGEYRMQAVASPTKLRVGDPLTLTLEFERGKHAGSLELISAPDLSAIPQMSEDFDLIDTNPTGRNEGSKKKFAYAMRPKRPGVNIPAFDVMTFDPQTEEFTSIKTTTIPLEVTDAEKLSSGDLVGTRSSTNTTTIKSKSQGIFQNITDPRELADERISLVIWGGTTSGIWLSAACLIGVVSFSRHKNSDPAWVRKQQARSVANRKLVEARLAAGRGESAQALRLVRSAIVGLVADQRNIVAEGLTTSNIDEILAASKVATDDRAAIRQLLEQIEAAEFGAGQTSDPQAAIETVGGLLAKLAKSFALLFAVLTWIGTTSSAAIAGEAGAKERAFVRGLQLFDEAKSPADYQAAADELEAIIKDGYCSGAVYYNLGNAYYRAGKFGQAILNYRKAKPYRPRDPYLAANLEQALAAAPGRLSEPSRPWWIHVLFWTDSMSYPAKVRMTFIILSLVPLIVAIGFLWQIRRSYYLASGLLVISLALGLEVAISSIEIYDSRRAVITGETIARKGTGNSYEPAFDQPLKDGAEFQILNETHDWTFGHFESIGDGWVRNEFVAK